MTDPLGQSQVLPYLAGLAKKGHKITLLSCEKKKRFDKYFDIINNITKSSGINWVYIPYTSKPKVISTVYDIFNLIKISKKLYKSEKFDIVHCRSYIASFAGLKLKNKFKTKFIFDMRGFWADERIDGKIWNINNLVYKFIYKYFKNKELQFLSKADYVISLTQNGKKEILIWGKLKISSDIIDVIPCCCDTNLFNPFNSSSENKVEIRKKIGITSNNLVLSYLGSIGTWYMLTEMLAFFKKILEKYPSAVFFFITPDSKDFIEAEAGKLNIPNENIFVKEAVRSQVPEMIAACDFSVFFIKPAYSKIASSPTKQAEIMSMGQAVICNAGIGDTDIIIKESGAGIVINSFSDSEYEKAVAQIENLKKLSPLNIRKYAINNFDVSYGIEKYNKIYHKLYNLK